MNALDVSNIKETVMFLHGIVSTRLRRRLRRSVRETKRCIAGRKTPKNRLSSPHARIVIPRLGLNPALFDTAQNRCFCEKCAKSLPSSELKCFQIYELAHGYVSFGIQMGRGADCKCWKNGKSPTMASRRQIWGAC